MKQYQGIGLLSGTSMDGLDIVCCRFEEEQDHYTFELLACDQIPFDQKWHARLKHLMHQSAEVYAKTHVYFGHWLGEQTRDFISRHGLKPDFVASHGQTIFHQPERSFTAQIGDGETMVTYLPCPLVTNFRNKDVALQGEGAPLVPLGEQYLFPPDRIYLNLGGFANATFGKRAFDIAPCNIGMNYWVSECLEGMAYDEGGRLAAAGDVKEELLQALNALPYYGQAPPKTLGWEWVAEHVLPLLREAAGSPQDILRTLVEHLAVQVAQAVRVLRAEATPMVITGGGRHNQFLVQTLLQKLEPLGVSLDASVDPGWIDYKEAIIFAFLGLRVLTARPTTLPTVTGARQPAAGGAIHLPPSFHRPLI